MDLPQMEQDTVEVVNYLRTRFHRKRIFVVGHSWGSVLGLWLAHEHPDLICAYVGTGQLINAKQNDETAYRDALEAARERGNQQARRELESIAPFDPANFRKGSIARHWEEALLGPPPGPRAFTNIPRLLTDLLSAPEYSLADDYAFIRGQALSMNVLFPEVAKVDLEQLGPDFHVPIFFFEGRHDPDVRPAPVWDYYQKLAAPQKGFTWFEHSGHFAFYEEKQKFTDELVRHAEAPQ